MASATWALQRSVHATLIGDTDLLALLGGAHVFDHVPRGMDLPYVTFGASSENDWSTADEVGHELLFSLHVWTEALSPVTYCCFDFAGTCRPSTLPS